MALFPKDHPLNRDNWSGPLKRREKPMKEKFKSRKVRVFLITSLITTLGPLLGLPGNVVAWLVQIAAAFIGGQGIADFGSQGLIPSGHKAKKESTKFLAYILSSLIVASGTYFDMPPEVAEWLTNIVTVFILGQGIADSGKQGLRRLSEAEFEELSIQKPS